MEQQFAEFAARLIELVNDTTVLAFAVPLVVVIVSVLKRFIPAEWVSGSTLHVLVQVVVWLAYIVFGKLGGDLAQFESWATTIAKVLELLVPVLPAGVAAVFGGHALYEATKKRGIAVFGYQRGSDSGAVPKALQRLRRRNLEPQG